MPTKSAVQLAVLALISMGRSMANLGSRFNFLNQEHVPDTFPKAHGTHTIWQGLHGIFKALEQKYCWGGAYHSYRGHGKFIQSGTQ